jgi:polyhydroxyalkanoate synthase
LALHLQLAWLDAVTQAPHAPAGGPDGPDAAARARLLESLAGLRTYWRHPRREPPVAGSVVWQEGACRLLDLGPADALPVLVVPSLINRARVLDLAEERSLLRHLAQAGFRPLLLDWGEPGPRERGYDVGGYVRGPASDALRAATRLGGRPPVLLGYCMGGLLALALATSRPARVAGLALLATPWDFHAGGERLGQILAAAFSPVTLQAAATGVVPVEALQAAFALLDPPALAGKFRGLAALESGDARAEAFVAVEDWLQDGVPLAGPAALEILWHWYAANLPARGLWRPNGRPVLPERLKVPFFLAIPRRDRIVPPASAEALAARLPNATVVRPEGGHVSMVVGRRHREELYEPLADWMRRLAARPTAVSDGSRLPTIKRRTGRAP